MQTIVLTLSLVLASVHAYVAPMDHPAAARVAAALRRFHATTKELYPAVKPAAAAHRPHTCAPRSPKGAGHLWAAINRAAARARINPYVLLAIQRHETGNYTSRLWRRCNNPGGIRPGGRYATYHSQEAGIDAHGACLAHPRYDRARMTGDPMGQIDAISRAGYAEHSPAWPMHVRRHYRAVLAGVPAD